MGERAESGDEAEVRHATFIADRLIAKLLFSSVELIG